MNYILVKWFSYKKDLNTIKKYFLKYNIINKGGVLMNKLGNWTFIIGFIVAILAGLLITNNSLVNNIWIVSLLVILGLVAGFLNVTQKEATPFLVASIALLAAGTANFGVFDNNYLKLSQVLQAIGIFVAPAAIIVAIKQVYSLASKR